MLWSIKSEVLTSNIFIASIFLHNVEEETEYLMGSNNNVGQVFTHLEIWFDVKDAK